MAAIEFTREEAEIIKACIQSAPINGTVEKLVEALPKFVEILQKLDAAFPQEEQDAGREGSQEPRSTGRTRRK